MPRPAVGRGRDGRARGRQWSSTTVGGRQRGDSREFAPQVRLLRMQERGIRPRDQPGGGRLERASSYHEPDCHCSPGRDRCGGARANPPAPSSGHGSSNPVTCKAVRAAPERLTGLLKDRSHGGCPCSPVARRNVVTAHANTAATRADRGCLGACMPRDVPLRTVADSDERTSSLGGCRPLRLLRETAMKCVTSRARGSTPCWSLQPECRAAPSELSRERVSLYTTHVAKDYQSERPSRVPSSEREVEIRNAKGKCKMQMPAISRLVWFCILLLHFEEDLFNQVCKCPQSHTKSSR